jgi:hypothetical protein
VRLAAMNNEKCNMHYASYAAPSSLFIFQSMTIPTIPAKGVQAGSLDERLTGTRTP